MYNKGVLDGVPNAKIGWYDMEYRDARLQRCLEDGKRSLAGPSGSKTEVEKLREEYMRIIDQMELPPKEEEEKEG